MELFKRIGFTFNARHRIWVCALGAVLGMMVLSQCSDSDDPTLIGPVGSTHSDVNYHYSDDGVTDISFDVDNDKLAISSKHHFENPAVIFPSASGELTVRVNVSGTDYGTAQTSDFNSWAPTSANTRGSDCGIPPTDQLYFAVGGTITVKSTLGTFNYDVAMGEGHGDGECLHTWWFGGSSSSSSWITESDTELVTPDHLFKFAATQEADEKHTWDVHSGYGAEGNTITFKTPHESGITSMKFEMSSIDADNPMENYSVSSHELWGGVTTTLNPATTDDGISLVINVKAGRNGNAQNGDWFSAKKADNPGAICSHHCPLDPEEGKPDKLNFAFVGTLTINDDPYEVVQGQGSDSGLTWDNWWFAGTKDKWKRTSHDYKQLRTPDKKYIVKSIDNDDHWQIEPNPDN